MVHLIAVASHQNLESKLLHLKREVLLPKMRGKRRACFLLPSSPAFLYAMKKSMGHFQFSAKRHLCWGAGLAASPSAIFHGGQVARHSFHTELFPSLLSFEGAFPACRQFGLRKFFLGQSPRPPTCHVILMRPIY